MTLSSRAYDAKFVQNPRRSYNLQAPWTPMGANCAKDEIGRLTPINMVLKEADASRSEKHIINDLGQN